MPDPWINLFGGAQLTLTTGSEAERADATALAVALPIRPDGVLRVVCAPASTITARVATS